MNKTNQPSRKEIIAAIKIAIENGGVSNYAKEAKKKEHPLGDFQNEYNDLPAFDFIDKDMEEIKKLKNFPNLLASDRQWTPLEKFFYAVLWKDSKLKSIKRIIDGMESALGDNNDSPEKFIFVYYYFGRHLRNRITEPLVDQHTMRACCLIQEKTVPAKFTAEDAKSYRRLFLDICKKENPTSYKETRLIDSLFFALGKYDKSYPAS